jgi:hypothetical protein
MDAYAISDGSAVILKCFLTEEATSKLEEFLSFLNADLFTLTVQPEQHVSSQSEPMQVKFPKY